MYRFLMPLFAGFAFAGASAFTATLSRCWGVRGGEIATSVLRNLLGMPLYFLGLVLAWQAPAPLLIEPGIDVGPNAHSPRKAVEKKPAGEPGKGAKPFPDADDCCPK